MMADIQPNVNTQPLPWYQNFLNSITQLGTAYLTFEQQRQLNQINVQRAALNQPPLSAAEYTAGFNVGVGRSTQNTLLIVAGIIAVAYLAGKKL